MKKIICLFFVAVLVAAASAAVSGAGSRINSPDKSDHADGMPYWYPESREEIDNFTDFHGEDLPLVVDDADIFTDAEEKKIEERIGEINEKYNVSYVVFTDVSCHGLSPEYYSSDFLHFNGYGTGDEYKAVVFFICMDPDNRVWRTTSINSDVSKFDDGSYDEEIGSSLHNGDYFDAATYHADLVEKTLKPNVGGPIIAGLVIGLIIALIRVSMLKSKMKVVRPTGASNYLVQGSYLVRNRRCDYLYTTVTRRAKPKSSSSSGGSSSGHSAGGSYSSRGGSF